MTVGVVNSNLQKVYIHEINRVNIRNDSLMTVVTIPSTNSQIVG